MALNLNNDQGTYIASEWKDQPDDYTPITPERLNHMEQGIQANSEDIKTLGDSVSQQLIQCGSVSFGDIRNTVASQAVTFPIPYKTAPKVIISWSASAGGSSNNCPVVRTGIPRTDGFSAIVQSDSTSTYGVIANWIAIGEPTQ